MSSIITKMEFRSFLFVTLKNTLVPPYILFSTLRLPASDKENLAHALYALSMLKCDIFSSFLLVQWKGFLSLGWSSRQFAWSFIWTWDWLNQIVYSVMFTTTYFGCTSTIFVNILSFEAVNADVRKRSLLTRLVETSVAWKLILIFKHGDD